MNKKLLKDNRGAALLSVMIAVAFIAILASALLYMSYSNYQMKVVNYESKVNFYDTEKDMTALSTNVRNAVAEAQKPVDKLKEVVGYHESNIGGVTYTRYNPASLAELVYPTGTTPANNDNFTFTSDGDTVRFSTAAGANENNYVVEDEGGNQKKITLKKVVIEHKDAESGYVNKITTDMVFRVKESPATLDPGGVGEFSVLMDSSISTGVNDGKPTRLTWYGNAFIGPGTYTAESSTDPGKVTAMTLCGNSYFTQKGDYMVVYGSIKLEDQAVMCISGGNLTVYGNIYIEDTAALLINGGTLYFPNLTNGSWAGTYANTPYGIKKADTATVLPADATTKAVILDKDDPNATNFNALKTQLGLDSATVDDGILPQVFEKTALERLKITNSATNTNQKLKYYGVDYGIRIHWEDQLNNGIWANHLIINTYQSGTTLQDGATLHATVLSVTPLKFQNQKNIILTQLGSDVFNALVDDNGGEYYSDATHKLHHKTTGNGDYNIEIGSYIRNDANTNVNKIIGAAVGGDSSQKIVDTAVGYENWTKE